MRGTTEMELTSSYKLYYLYRCHPESIARSTYETLSPSLSYSAWEPTLCDE
jgi:hypothetical protein